MGQRGEGGATAAAGKNPQGPWQHLSTGISLPLFMKRLRRTRGPWIPSGFSPTQADRPSPSRPQTNDGRKNEWLCHGRHLDWPFLLLPCRTPGVPEGRPLAAVQPRGGSSGPGSSPPSAYLRTTGDCPTFWSRWVGEAGWGREAEFEEGRAALPLLPSNWGSPSGGGVDSHSSVQC